MSHSLGAKLSRLRHKGYITDIEYQRLKKALEQEPSGELISRQAVLAEIFKKPAWHNSDGSYYHADDIRDAVNSVKPQEPTGHWYRISSHDTYYGLTDFKCSKCGEEISKEGDWLYEYCPRCGVRMEVEQNE